MPYYDFVLSYFILPCRSGRLFEAYHYVMS